MTRQVTLGKGPGALRTDWHEWGDGRGATLFCLHPLGQWGGFFGGFAAALGPGWRVVGFDQRGHGAAADQPAESLGQMVEDAALGVDRLGGPVHLLGHSMGGAVAAGLAPARPGAFASLSIVASPARGLPVFAERARAVRDGSLAAVTETTIARWFGTTEGLPQIAGARAALARMTPEGFDAAWRALASFGGFEAVAAALPPALVVSFTDDLSTPPPVMDEIAATLRAAGVEVARADIGGAGHMGMLQQPEAVARCVADFAARHRNNPHDDGGSQ